LMLSNAVLMMSSPSGFRPHIRLVSQVISPGLGQVGIVALGERHQGVRSVAGVASWGIRAMRMLLLTY